MAEQLILKGITLKVDATFENFYPGSNQQLVNLLHQLNYLNEGNFLYIAGNEGSGKSHLLQATCHYAIKNHLHPFYLPLNQIHELSAEVLDDLETLDVICLDNIEEVAGDPVWERAIFNLYNRLHAAKRALIVSARLLPQDLAIQLADLKSRLHAGLLFSLHSLTDEEKLIVLQLNARARGLKLSEEVAYFLLNRCSREIKELLSILDALDQASLVEKRRLTIPFIKSVLGI